MASVNDLVAETERHSLDSSDERSILSIMRRQTFEMNTINWIWLRHAATGSYWISYLKIFLVLFLEDTAPTVRTGPMAHSSNRIDWVVCRRGRIHSTCICQPNRINIDNFNLIIGNCSAVCPKWSYIYSVNNNQYRWPLANETRNEIWKWNDRNETKEEEKKRSTYASNLRIEWAHSVR